MIGNKYEVNDINRFYNDKFLYFIIGNYISAEFLVKEDDYIVAYEKLSSMLDCLPESIIPDDEKQRNTKRLSDCLDLIKTEYNSKFNKELCI
jgi:hypothetical protein